MEKEPLDNKKLEKENSELKEKISNLETEKKILAEEIMISRMPRRETKKIEVSEAELTSLAIERKHIEGQKYASQEWKTTKIIIGFEQWCNCTGRDILKDTVKQFREYLTDGGDYKMDDRFLCRLGKTEYDAQVKRNYHDALEALKLRCQDIEMARKGQWEY